MKTNTIQVIATTAAIATLTGLVTATVAGNFLTGIAVAVSYLAVVALVAIAASDYRSAPKAYFLAPVATGHFRGNRTNVTLPQASGKSRLAA